MILGESPSVEVESGVLQLVFVPVPITKKLEAVVPSLRHTHRSTDETTHLYDFRVRERNSSRQIVAKSLIRIAGGERDHFLKPDRYFLPKLHQKLFFRETMPFVLGHMFEPEEFVIDSKIRLMLEECMTSPYSGAVRPREDEL